MEDKNSFSLRPAGRHVLAIGRELIKDNYSAVMELVKNAYDADSKSVHIKFILDHVNKKIVISVTDYGHGMTRDVVLSKWLIPSTDDKLKRKKSPNGRIMQGKKGLGRYAAAILGNNLSLRTISLTGDKTEVEVDWDAFDKAEFMDQVILPVKTESVKNPSQTIINIIGDGEYYDFWKIEEYNKLRFELKKLISPIHEGHGLEIFDIYLEIDDGNEGSLLPKEEKIEPFPLLEFYDYKISGSIQSNGLGVVNFVNNKEKATQNESIKLDLGRKTKCGIIEIDVRVYDRESESIDNLIKKGLRDDSGKYLNKTQTKSLLNQSNGIGVYRNGFRIRPLGDPDFDWLKLNASRVQNPSMHVGSNQVIGFVKIQSEETSNLKETSARDGLKDNIAYQSLIEVVQQSIKELEIRRFTYRRKSGLTKTAVKIEQDFEKLFSFDDVKDKIKNKLLQEGVSNKSSQEIFKILEHKENDSAKIIEDIRKKVAIYQGQATLGKIIDVVMHEGRRPIGFFSNQTKNLEFWVKQFSKKPTDDVKKEILSITEGFGINSKVISDLFKRLDPLATRQRGQSKNFNVKAIIQDSFFVFKNQVQDNDITIDIHSPDVVEFTGWINDFYVIITNLIDNSIFWLIDKNILNKSIEINIHLEDSKFKHLDFRDNGPGVSKHLIESGAIFEPEFSTKSNGVGIGLSIAGEAAHRNNLDLKIFESDIGAYFRLQIKD
ncbi:ATP-binding protein [Psychromonas sp. MB-3u-54]|uniref:sensor histidine kinase n=1 Tax=Psychromonas sp. MB-3u-54 TaxID=2058319 RepID=UPI000C34CBD5|nr:sensor histidine kinase [Psychromonas sp. MB-3u-54]PKH03570.1 ATP-binding protein [Psychromonas sp. MB-3u-54]